MFQWEMGIFFFASRHGNEMYVVVKDTLKAVRNSCCLAISVAKISDWIWCCSSRLDWRSSVSIMPLSTRQAMADRQWWFSSTEAFCSRHDIPTHWHHYQHGRLSIIHTLQEKNTRVDDAVLLQHFHLVLFNNSFPYSILLFFCAILLSNFIFSRIVKDCQGLPKRTCMRKTSSLQ